MCQLFLKFVKVGDCGLGASFFYMFLKCVFVSFCFYIQTYAITTTATTGTNTSTGTTIGTGVLMPRKMDIDM